MRTNQATLLVSACLALGAVAAGKNNPVTLVTQEQDQWCWAGSTRSVLLAFGVDRKQCELAEWARQHNTAFDVDLGTVDCCTAPSGQCNNWNYFWGSGGSIEDLFLHFAPGGKATRYDLPNGALTMTQLSAAIDEGKLVYIRWSLNNGGGHFVIGHGYSGTTVSYMNPWPGEGLEVAEYSWVLSGDVHRWKSSLVVEAQSAPGTCAGKVDGASCDDGNACTTQDKCSGGTCAGTAVRCGAANSCVTDGTCNPATGKCVTGASKADGTSCDDGNPCTTSDHCTSGTCRGAAVSCPSLNPCTSGATCDPSSGLCQGGASKADGTSCDDGDPCTTADQCRGGRCAGSSIACTAADQCHLPGTCDSSTGACSSPAAADGTTCGVGTCQVGVCRASPPAEVPSTPSTPAPGRVSGSGCSSAGGVAPVLVLALIALGVIGRRREVLLPSQRRPWESRAPVERHPKRWLLIPGALGLALGGLASCATRAQCASSADCRAEQTCLPSRVCAYTCQSERQCTSGEKCSASGGCVERLGGCGTSADCAPGETCLVGGTCGRRVVDGGTDHGASGGGTGGSGGSSQGGGAPGQCAEDFTSTGAGANLMIVLDHSHSMGDFVGGMAKWTAATEAITRMTRENPAIHFGLEMFSVASGECSAGSILLPVQADAGAAIVKALPAFADGNATQIAGGLTTAATDPALSDPGRVAGVVLITDGMQNCQGSTYVTERGPFDDPRMVVKALFARPTSIRTWVVGFGAGVDASMLGAMAVAGGTARATEPRYYQADQPAALAQALQAISNAAQGCSFVLGKTPGDVSQLFVAIDRQLVPRDSSHITGWDYDAATNRVTLFGPACDSLANTTGAKLTIQYGCSDGFIETAGDVDGGLVFTLDAGSIG